MVSRRVWLGFRLGFRLGVRLGRIAGLLVLGAYLSGASALAETRLALVMGNSGYRAVTPLPNPVNDAKAVADDLKAAAFDVTLASDLGQSDMRRAIRDFAAKVAGAGADTVALVYYAGHGVQVDGENFLVPVDARIQREADIPIEAVRLADLMSALAAVPSKMRIVILDACRNNPFATEKSARGLAIVDAPTGSIVAYSTAPGTAATDGAGANSPYTAAFLEVSKEPHLQIEQLFKQVRLKVNDATKGQQTPWESSSLTSNFWFLPANEVAPAPNAIAAAPAAGGPSTSRQSAQGAPAVVAATTAPAAQPAAQTAAPTTVVATTTAPAAQPAAPSTPPVPRPKAPPAPQPGALPAPTTFEARFAPAPPGPPLPPAMGPNVYAAPPPPMPVADMRLLPPDDAYDLAIEEDTVDAYEQFLLVYPVDPRAEWIRTTLALRVDAIAWRYASVMNTPAAYAAYVAAYPGGIYVQDAVRLQVRPRLRPIDVVIAPRVLVAPPAPRIALPLIQMQRAAPIVLPAVLTRPGRFNRARLGPQFAPSPQFGPRVPGVNPAFAPRLNANAVAPTPHAPSTNPAINPAAAPRLNANAVAPGPHAPHVNSSVNPAVNPAAAPRYNAASAPPGPGAGPGQNGGPQFHRPLPGNPPPVANAAPNATNVTNSVPNATNAVPNGPHPPNPQFRPGMQRAQFAPGPRPGPKPPAAKCEGKRCKK
jgi:uncharacterized caspase-like protein